MWEDEDALRRLQAETAWALARRREKASESQRHEERIAVLEAQLERIDDAIGAGADLRAIHLELRRDAIEADNRRQWVAPSVFAAAFCGAVVVLVLVAAKVLAAR